MARPAMAMRGFGALQEQVTKVAAADRRNRFMMMILTNDSRFFSKPPEGLRESGEGAGPARDPRTAGSALGNMRAVRKLVIVMSALAAFVLNGTLGSRARAQGSQRPIAEPHIYQEAPVPDRL